MVSFRSKCAIGFFSLSLLFGDPQKCLVRAQAAIDPENQYLPLHNEGRPNVFQKDSPPEHMDSEMEGTKVGDRWIPPKRESVFITAHQKGGSSTLRNVINGLCSMYAENHFCMDHWIFRPDQPCECEEFNRYQFTDRGAWCAGCTGKQWITMFREPMSRLISAFKWCQVTTDELCNYEKDICSFGKKWGNYQMNRFLEYPLAAHTNPFSKLSSPAFNIQKYGLEHCPKCEAFDPAPYHTEPPNGEYMFSAIFEHFGLNDVSTPQGKLHLDRIIKILTDSYVAVGLLEEWDESMEMYYAATGLQAFLNARGAIPANKDTKVPEEHRKLTKLELNFEFETGTEIDTEHEKLVAALLRNGNMSSSNNVALSSLVATMGSSSIRGGGGGGGDRIADKSSSSKRRLGSEEMKAWERDVEKQADSCKGDLLRYMAGDIALYEHAKELFQMQRYVLRRWKEEGKVQGL